jgi:putative ABC transport system permease protein
MNALASIRRELLFTAACLSDAHAEIRAQSVRTLLAVLGLSFGVAFGATVIDFANAVRSYLMNDVIGRIYTPNSFQVERLASVPQLANQTNSDWKARRDQRRPPLRLADGNAVGAAIPLGSDWASEDLGQVVATVAGSRKLAVTAVLAAGHYQRVKDLRLDTGRMPSTEEIAAGTRVIVVGQDVATHFFGKESALGKRVRFAGVSYLIVGVAASRGSVLGISLDRFVVAPTRSPLRRALRLGDGTATLWFRAGETNGLNFLREIVRRTLRHRHRLPAQADDDFSIESADDIATLWFGVEKKLVLFAAAFPIAALLTSVLVIANVMLTRVSLRVSEIGLRRALGATNSDITKQFLIESLVLSSVGACVGLLISWTSCLAITLTTPVAIHPTLGSVVLAIAAGAVVGILAGVGPAITAARLDPIVALGRA